MLNRLTQQSPDALLALIKLHDADPAPDKIDLGVGVFRTESGATPVFGAIKAAEQLLVDRQDSKAYLGPEGDMGFVQRLIPHIFGEGTVSDRLGGMQTPGGTGAVRLALALAKRAGVTRVLMGTPSWPNHAQIVADLDLELVAFNHATPDGAADIEALLSALGSAGEGAAVLLHGCCHNPTGVDYTPAEWDRIAAALADGAVLPIVDLAYQGLGVGMEADAYGPRVVLAAVAEALVAYSCDKNFGLYRDRVGALYWQGADADGATRIMSNGAALARANWSMPPDHGAAAVRLVLEDAALTADWLAELEGMRQRISGVRKALAAHGTAGTLDLTPYGRQQGMFAMLPLTPAQIAALRSEHSIYMAGSGRINIAGLTAGNLDKFTAALAAVTA
ncbi:aromatic amino acid transaminase [Croceibacterium ferulae]|uniref:amino acid aminotransferase n=1 Tax=Croceibacterium ferulae TaxID=1854641 RepID=UPI000EB533B2|nr:aromatic amino acid transaminase [Croceibacterium ferulae]